MKDLLCKLKHIRIWRWTLMSIFIWGLSFDSYNKVLSISGMRPTVFEIFLKQINDVSSLSLYLIFLLIIFDVGYENMSFSFSKGSKTLYRILNDFIYIFTLILLFLFLVIVIDIFTLLLKVGNIDFNNKWIAASCFISSSSTVPALEVNGLTPILATTISFLLFFLRFGFITATVFTINQNCKKRPWGYLSGLAICLMDAVVYYTFEVINPIGIFPFEHSFLGSALKLTPNLLLNIIISVFYWVVLTVLIGIVLYFTKRSKILKSGVVNEADNLSGY